MRLYHGTEKIVQWQITSCLFAQKIINSFMSRFIFGFVKEAQKWSAFFVCSTQNALAS